MKNYLYDARTYLSSHESALDLLAYWKCSIRPPRVMGQWQMMVSWPPLCYRFPTNFYFIHNCSFLIDQSIIQSESWNWAILYLKTNIALNKIDYLNFCKLELMFLDIRLVCRLKVENKCFDARKMSIIEVD